MKRQAIQPPGMTKPGSPYSLVVISGDLVATGGQVGRDSADKLVGAEIKSQARQALDNLRECLRAAGCELEDVIKVSAFLQDARDYEAFNDVYREFFAEPYPARTTVQANLIPEGLLVEVDALARRN